MSETKLKPCPFCGGELEYSFLLGASKCKGCGVMIGFPKLTRHEDKIIATNTRKPMANIVEKLEELPYGRSYHDYAEKGIVHRQNLRISNSNDSHSSYCPFHSKQGISTDFLCIPNYP